MNERELWVVDLGVIPYMEALQLQHELVARKKAGELEADILLLLEHPAVITLGRRGDETNVVAPPEVLRERNINVHRVERGGDVTYHGPGQLVGYPIVSLRKLPNRKDVGRYVWALQEAIIRTCASYNIRAERIDNVIGVWVREVAPDLERLPWDDAYRTRVEALIGPFRDRKIAAIGARVEGWVSFHGFALNVNTDLTDFGLIVPCGLQDRGVTSMEVELGNALPMDPIKREIAAHLAELWQHRVSWREPRELGRVDNLQKG